MNDIKKTQNLYLNYDIAGEWSDDPYYSIVNKNILSNEFIKEIDLIANQYISSKGIDLFKPEHLFIIELDQQENIYGIDYVFYSQDILQKQSIQFANFDLNINCESTNYCFIKNSDGTNLYRIKITFRI